jgi:hypothetical protein
VVAVKVQLADENIEEIRVALNHQLKSVEKTRHAPTYQQAVSNHGTHVLLPVPISYALAEQYPNI